MGDACDAEDEFGAAFVEVDVLTAEAEVGASAVSGGGDECEGVGVLVAGVAAPFEEASGLVAGPDLAQWSGLGCSWWGCVGRGVVVNEAESCGFAQ